MATTETTDNSLPDVKRMSTRDARNQFSDLIGQVHYTGEPVIIERSGKPMVVMLPIEAYKEMLADQAALLLSEHNTGQNDQPLVEPLFGAFPELAVITDEDVDWAKQLWKESFEKQLRIIEGLEP
jgi:prevent-host-death family protein